MRCSGIVLVLSYQNNATTLSSCGHAVHFLHGSIGVKDQAVGEGEWMGWQPGAQVYGVGLTAEQMWRWSAWSKIRDVKPVSRFSCLQ